MKLGKSHRKESDWEVIKEILGRRNVLTFIPPKRAKGLTTIEKVLCEDGNLIVFTNMEDCTRHIQIVQFKGKFWKYVEIGSIPFVNVLDIADQHGMNVLIEFSVMKPLPSKLNSTLVYQRHIFQLFSSLRTPYFLSLNLIFAASPHHRILKRFHHSW